MKIVNLTPHALHVQLIDGSILTIPASGQVARCKETTETVGTLPVDGGEAALTRTVLGAVEGLPDEQPGVLLVVSALVRLAAPHRRDVVSPGPLLRDEGGRPVGCQGFSCN